MQNATSKDVEFKSSSETNSALVEPIKDTRRKTLLLLSKLSQSNLDQRRVEKRWSPGEVFDHLVKFDQFFLRSAKQLLLLAQTGQSTRLEYSFQQLDVGPACIPKRALSSFTIPLTIASRIIPKSAQRLLAGFLPIQHPQFATPIRNRPKMELQCELKQTLHEYIELFAQSHEFDLSRMTISHPLLGKRSLLELPEFVVVHERRHLRKMQSLLNE